MRIQNSLEIDGFNRYFGFAGLWYPLAVHRQRQVQRSQRLHYLPEFGPPLSCLDLDDPLAPHGGRARQLLLGHAPRFPRPPDQMAEIGRCVDSHW